MNADAVAFIALAVFIALYALGFLVREWWRRKVIRKSLELSDKLIGLLSQREIIMLNRGLKAFLVTAEGKQLADDPRIQRRLALLKSRIAGFASERSAAQRARALRITGLKELPADSEEAA